MTHDIPRPIRRLLRQSAARAEANELSRELASLAAKFDAWRAGQLDCFELNDAIHRHHNGPAREIYKRYNLAGPMLPFIVANAIHTGVLPRDEVAPQLLDYLARYLTSMEQEEGEPPTGE